MGLSVYDYQDFLDKGWRRSGHWLYKVRVPAAAPSPARLLHPWASPDSGRAASQSVLSPRPPPSPSPPARCLAIPEATCRPASAYCGAALADHPRSRTPRSPSRIRLVALRTLSVCRPTSSSRAGNFAGL